MADNLKKLKGLLVRELKVELEKRSLDTNGKKDVLIERLSNFLISEGHDPDDYLFDLYSAHIQENDNEVHQDESENITIEELSSSEDEMLENNECEESSIITHLNETTGSSVNIDSEIVLNEISDSADDVNQENLDESIENIDENSDKDEEIISQSETLEDNKDIEIENDENVCSKSDLQSTENSTDIVTESHIDEVANDDIIDLNLVEDADNNFLIDDSEKEPLKSTNKSTVRKEVHTTDSKSGTGDIKNLWITNLSSKTRAADLKQLCSKYGKVVGAKIVTNAKSPGDKCFGYVSMSSSLEASECLKKLNDVKLHGNSIKLEKIKGEPGSKVVKKVDDGQKLEKEKSRFPSRRAKDSPIRLRRERDHGERRRDSRSHRIRAPSPRRVAPRIDRRSELRSRRHEIVERRIRRERELRREQELNRRIVAEERARIEREKQERERIARERARLERERIALERERRLDEARLERERLEANKLYALQRQAKRRYEEDAHSKYENVSNSKRRLDESEYMSGPKRRYDDPVGDYSNRRRYDEPERRITEYDSSKRRYDDYERRVVERAKPEEDDRSSRRSPRRSDYNRRSGSGYGGSSPRTSSRRSPIDRDARHLQLAAQYQAAALSNASASIHPGTVADFYARTPLAAAYGGTAFPGMLSGGLVPGRSNYVPSVSSDALYSQRRVGPSVRY